jgi:hypothetical protein
MAEETPFGTSFGNYGDPRRYIGKGEMPAKKIQEKIAKIQASPLANVLGIMFAGDNQKSSPAGAVPSPTTNQTGVAPVNPSMGVSPVVPNLGAESVNSVTPMQGTDVDGDGVVDNFWGVPSASKTISSLQNPTDFNPLAPDTSNQMPVSGNDYQNAPGYGKLAKTVQTMFGMG